MDNFILVLFSILLCVLAMVYFKNICAFTSSIIPMFVPMLRTEIYGGRCHDKHKYTEDLVVDGLNVYNCLRDFLVAQGINKNPLHTTNPKVLYYILIKSLLIATTGTIHFVAKDDAIVYDVLLDILYNKSSKSTTVKIPEDQLKRIIFYYALYTESSYKILHQAKQNLDECEKNISFVDSRYKNDYIAVDAISKKKDNARYTKEQKSAFVQQMAAISIRKDKIYSNINERSRANAALDKYITAYELEHALRGIDDNLALFTLSKVIKSKPKTYYVTNDMLSEMPRKLCPNNYIYKIFTKDAYGKDLIPMNVTENIQSVVDISQVAKIMSKCMFKIDPKDFDICFNLYTPSGKDGKEIIPIAEKNLEVLERCDELANLYVLLQLYLSDKNENDTVEILKSINVESLCMEYGQKMTSYDTMQRLIIHSDENKISSAEIKKTLLDKIRLEQCTNETTSYLRRDVPFDVKIILSIRYLTATNNLQAFDACKYIDRIKYIVNKIVKQPTPPPIEPSHAEPLIKPSPAEQPTQSPAEPLIQPSHTEQPTPLPVEPDIEPLIQPSPVEPLIQPSPVEPLPTEPNIVEPIINSSLRVTAKPYIPMQQPMQQPISQPIPQPIPQQPMQYNIQYPPQYPPYTPPYIQQYAPPPNLIYYHQPQMYHNPYAQLPPNPYDYQRW